MASCSQTRWNLTIWTLLQKNKRTASVLLAIASTWSSCVEMPTQRLFLASCATEGHQICGADVQDACAHAKALGVKICMRADDACIEWACKVLGKETRKGFVMKVLHSLQEGHPRSGKQWMKMTDKILVDDLLGFQQPPMIDASTKELTQKEPS